eukprot:Tbor_TRINITY_DN17_c0_g1::TRINITY_DN17_c0_g1_i2::g.15108::m.15108/K01623/ALDO; fructose-bisphosphate aldolase, class I
MSSRVEVYRSHLPSYNEIKLPHYAELRSTVQQMTAPGKGLLAADESPSSVSKRFAPFNLENNADNRRKYRSLMIGAKGFEKYISGVIFHEETLTQNMDDGTTFPEYCKSIGVVPGIKTDQGLADLVSGAPGEQMTQGLDNYVSRATKFYQMGARFCKWRNAYKIQNGTVSEALVKFNAETLARYAVLSQVAGLVPIVEPEVMIDGTHSIDECQRVSEHVWSAVITALHHHGVNWECCLLKPNMVVPGAESGVKVTAEVVAEYTIRTLSRTIPVALSGITFLSGGISEVEASEYLNAMNRSPLPRPWRLTFSYARALQSSALKAWAGKDENLQVARKAFLHRAEMNSKAQLGTYDRKEDDKTSESLYIKGNTY